ncbi:SMP-30/gluconolactonase/LRE family protein [Longimicrobium terrae]|uniref:Sugar lactone lactonase YvrE n=1 Tax=Longimicrobium terrae TaxID=1639882 RepID=A0A841GXP7_9BACT|nr:SMP-30/gluconolactonase/LRE family protein [Longimicrobium terrae]MBB4636130.1 sugar lactone lactonase YvrE [Longimicrobium terrae]MBB6070525.1 sugar lactone lactonase YvrE [Longimicrobium terrae]NNC29514.1 hypothetical protein [Longimicrobium terrae]
MFQRIASWTLVAAVAAGCSHAAPPPPPMPSAGGPSWPVAPARLTLAPTATLDPALVPPLPHTRMEAHAQGFAIPESVIHDPEQDIYFVSNINGRNADRDNNGFLSRMRPDGTVETREWVAGGRNGVTLNAPKGMAIVGDTLWVADIDAVRGFDRRTGAALATIDLRAQGAVFLNDLAEGPDGVYATDTGTRYDERGVPIPDGGRIYRLAGGAASVVTADPLMQGPNGIAYDRRNRRMIVVSYGGTRILSLQNGVVRQVATGPGQFDGVAVLDDGTILVSSQATSAIHRYDDDGDGGAKAIDNIMGVGDISVDARRGRLLLARLNQNRVEAHLLPR